MGQLLEAQSEVDAGSTMASPLFPFTVAFCIGIVLSGRVQTPPYSLLIASSLLLLCSWILLFKTDSRCFTFAALASFTSLGLTWSCLYDSSFGPHHLRTLVRTNQLDLSQPCRVTGICVSSEIRERIGEQIELSVSSLENRRSTYLTQGKIRLALYYENEFNRQTSVARKSSPMPSSPPIFPEGQKPSPLISPGDEVEILVNLKRIRNFNDPGQFDYVSYLERQGIFLVGTVKSELLIRKIATDQGKWLQRIVQRVRKRLLTQLDKWRPLSGENTSALKALLLGTKQDLSPQLEEDFQSTGIYHVLVVSGQHVAIIAAVLLGLMRILRFPLLFKLMVTAVGLVFYCLLTENQPSIVRATLMTFAFLLTLHFDRDRDLLNSLSLSGLALLIVDPFWLLDPGFQLSYLAVLAIALIGLPLVKHVTQPYREALRNLAEPSYDAHFSPRQADLRLLLRLRLDDWNQIRAVKVLRLGKPIIVWPLVLILYLADIFLISAGIQLLFVVLMVLYFHRVSLISLVLNILVIPLVGVIVPLGFLSLFFAGWVPVVSQYLMLLCQFLTRILLGLASHFADPAWGNFRVATPPAWVVLLYLSSLGLFVWQLFGNQFDPKTRSSPNVSGSRPSNSAGHASGDYREKRKILAIAALGIVAMAALLLLVVQPFPPRKTPGRLEVTVLDVHQGDSAFLQFPDNATMLIDGGGLPARGFGEDFSGESFDIGERVVCPFLWSKGVKRIYTVILTHAHHDHLSGLNSVIKNFRVDQLWIGQNPPTAEYVTFMKNAIKGGIQVRSFGAGDKINFHAATVSFLNPERMQVVGPLPSNNDSLAFQLRYMRRSYLATGDLEKKIENRLLEQPFLLASDVLKVAHQGSRSSTSKEFLDRVMPVVAVISTAQSGSFGHPHPEVLKRLSEKHVRTFRTDTDGAVEISTDGRDLQVSSFLEEGK